MKGKVIFITLALVITALLPFAAVSCNTSKQKAESASATADFADKPENNEEKKENNPNDLLCALTAAWYEEDMSEDAIKAAAIIMNTNYNANPDSFDLSDKEVCVYEKDADNALKENYADIRKAVNSVKENKLILNGKTVYVPCSKASNGNTFTSEKYSYLRAVASPWDCFSQNYSPDTKCVGVSISGIDYLCKNGCTYEQALKWYLPEFSIE